MPRSLQLEFLDEGVRILPNQAVSGLQLEAQNACLNLGIQQGSDPIYPTRGTNLLLQGLNGRLVDDMAAFHEGNFAAVDTVFFLNSIDPFPDNDAIIEIKLQVESYQEGKLEFNTVMLTESGAQIGQSLTL